MIYLIIILLIGVVISQQQSQWEKHKSYETKKD